FLQFTRRARSLAPANEGSNSAARMAMMAITTSSSTSVNARNTSERRNPGGADFMVHSLQGRRRWDEISKTQTVHRRAEAINAKVKVFGNGIERRQQREIHPFFDALFRSAHAQRANE